MRRLLGAAGAGVLAFSCITGAATAASGPPTLTANRHLAEFFGVEYGDSITLSGHESSSGVRAILLQANQWPFTGGFHTTAITHSTGSYSLVVKPRRATRYRVVVSGGGQSQTITVFVDWRTLRDDCNICGENNLGGKHTLAITASFLSPTAPVAVTGPVYLYYAQNNGSRVKPTTLRRVKTAPLGIARNVLHVKINYPVTFPVGTPFEFSYRYCWKDAYAGDGVGLPGHHHCGDPAITNPREYLG